MADNFSAALDLAHQQQERIDKVVGLERQASTLNSEILARKERETKEDHDIAESYAHAKATADGTL